MLIFYCAYGGRATRETELYVRGSACDAPNSLFRHPVSFPSYGEHHGKISFFSLYRAKWGYLSQCDIPVMLSNLHCSF